MFWLLPLHVVGLFLATGLSIWAAVIARSRRAVPGSNSFGWLMLAVAHWCLISALHALVTETDARIALNKVQFLSLGSIGVLWLWFASGYARIAWPSRPGVRAALWLIPITTILLAITNEAHGLIWTDIALRETPWGARLVYTPGAWFWVHVVFTYVLVAIGSWMLAVGVSTFPPPYRPQFWAVIVGVMMPVASNMTFLTQWRARGGFDITPLAFAVSGLCFTWGLYRYRLFGLVPVARDMVVDSMEDGVMVLDGDRRIVDLNAAWSDTPAAPRGASGARLARWCRGGTTPPPRRGPRPTARRWCEPSPGRASSKCGSRRCAIAPAISPAGWW